MVNRSVHGLDKNNRPSLYEYIAASMITIATVWLWAQAAIHLPLFFESAPTPLVTAASYGFYTLGGALASYLVLYKTGNRQIMTGMKVGVFSFAASTLYYSLSTGLQPNLIAAMLISFLLGGYLGALAMIKRTTRGIEAPPVDADTEPEENTSVS